jgi:hypothetical protein
MSELFSHPVCVQVIYILVSFHTFWTYCIAIYELALFLKTIFHNKIFLELEDIINN